MPFGLVSFLLLIGSALIGAALFAEAIGLDNDPGWGNGRVALLILGIVFIACGILYSRYSEKLSSGSYRLRLGAVQKIGNFLRPIRIYWHTFPVLIFVILVYIWFASSGSWVHWISPTRYYADLANSFKQGKLHLLTRPDTDLLNLPDPFDPLARTGVEFPIDYSLYEGKFYLYWGPAPALILLLISPFTEGRVGDLYLVFSFVCGIFILQSLIVVMVWDRFFDDLPKWMLHLSILMLGLTAPWMYMLINEPNGRIYEAAISGAQFFLLTGFLLAIVRFNKTPPSALTLTIIGFLWALAIGTRLVIALPIVFMILMLAYQIWKTARLSWTGLAMKLIPLSLPLVLCLVGVGWYNWARFGSVSETGFSYALAGVDLQKYHNGLFSLDYLAPNFYNYILKPPASMARFPFLYSETALLPFDSQSQAYGANPVTGLLFIAPFTVCAIPPVIMFLVKTAQHASSRVIEKNNGSDFLAWIIISLLGIFSSAFGLLLIFFWPAMRYFGDFMPAISLISILGFWKGYQFLGQRPTHRAVYSILGIILIILSIVIGTFLSIAVKQFGFHGFPKIV